MTVNIFVQLLTNLRYSGSRLSEIQEPHPQPPPRKRGGGYDVCYLSAYRWH